MLGFEFHANRPDQDRRSPFERLLELFIEVVTHTSGDVEEAMDWMRALDDQHGLTNEDYTLDDFYEELKAKGVPVLMLHPGFNKTGMTAKYAAIWEVEGAVDASIGAKRVLHEVKGATMERTGKFM